MKKSYGTAVCYCGNSFKKKNKWHKHCSANCRWAEWDSNNPRVKKEITTVVK